MADEIITHLPENVYLSFDVDGLDPKLCPNTGTPVPGGLEIDQIYYLLKQVLKSGRKFIGFDLSETGVGESEWDANVSARILWKLCNFLVAADE
jgi:agmatinase